MNKNGTSEQFTNLRLTTLKTADADSLRSLPHKIFKRVIENTELCNNTIQSKMTMSYESGRGNNEIKGNRAAKEIDDGRKQKFTNRLKSIIKIP